MKALRIELVQASANYRREESDRNRMTYPLPPLSTIIGAIHYACNFQELKPMDISVQGDYGSMHREPYTDNCFLNTVFNDRGILVKMTNESMLSGAYTKVAAAKKSQGNDFRKGITIDVYEPEMLGEYRDLLNKRDKIDEYTKKKIKPILDLIKKRKKYLSKKKKELSKDDVRYEKVVTREMQIKKLEKTINEGIKTYKKDNYDIPYSAFRTLVTSIKYYEILDEVKLLIHVKADEAILQEIYKNVYNIKSLGRSEDFVDILDAQIIELQECNENVSAKYSAYLNYDDVINKKVKVKNNRGSLWGTKYYINKTYQFKDENKKLIRVFNKAKVIYTSNYSVSEPSENIWIDTVGDKKYIVNFI